jgi:hypothetical protein
MTDQIYFTTKSAAHILAYIHRRPAKYLQGRCLPPTDLRVLADWIGWPAPQLRTIRDHPLLAIHLATLYATGLINLEADYWTCTLDTFSWLRASAADQIDRLEAPFASASIEEARAVLGLEDTLSIDYLAYAQQMLHRARHAISSPAAFAEWQNPPKSEQKEELWLVLPDDMSPQLTFHLLQLGEWGPGQPLRMTPPSILQAVQRGYGKETIRAILQRATGDDALAAWLDDWIERAGTYQVRSVWLLSTRQPAQLAQIYEKRRLSAYIEEQISPRHAIVNEALVTPLQRWLTRRGYGLQGTRQIEKEGQRTLSQNVYTAVSLQVLARLARFIPLPLSIPHHVMQMVEAALSPEEQETAARLRKQIMADLRQAVQGRDAFFPAETSPDPAWINVLRRAIQEGANIGVTYQSLADYRPRYRRLHPLRLEERGNLLYLHAYCYQAETNLTFRLDRIKSLHEDEEE